MGLPRIRTECYRALKWGHKYENALRRMLADKELPPLLREQAEDVAAQVNRLADLLLTTGQSISAD